jgi:hypothetical protein
LNWRDPSQKRAGGVAQGVNPEFKTQYHKKKKKKEREHKIVFCVTGSILLLREVLI